MISDDDAYDEAESEFSQTCGDLFGMNSARYGPSPGRMAVQSHAMR